MKTLKSALVILFLACISMNVNAQKTHTKYYTNGSLKIKGFFDKNGKAIGEWIFFHENGKKDVKFYMLNNEFDGLYTKFDKNEFLEHTQNYKKGNRVGPKKGYYNDKTLMYIGNFTNEKASGEWEFYHTNGKLMKTGNFTDGKRSGQWKYYSFSGEIDKIGHFVNDKRSGEWKMYVRGKVRDTRNYINGKMVN